MMKKKLALLLAGIMTLTTIPVNVFASTQEVATRITGNPVVTAQSTALRQKGLQGSGTVNTGNSTSYFTEGTNLTLAFPRNNINLISPIQIELILENAVWNIGENIGMPQLQNQNNWNRATNTLKIDTNLGVSLQATPNTNRGVLTIAGKASPFAFATNETQEDIKAAKEHIEAAKYAVETAKDAANPSDTTNATIAGLINVANATQDDNATEAVEYAFEKLEAAKEAMDDIDFAEENNTDDLLNADEHAIVESALEAVEAAVAPANTVNGDDTTILNVAFDLPDLGTATRHDAFRAKTDKNRTLEAIESEIGESIDNLSDNTQAWLNAQHAAAANTALRSLVGEGVNNVINQTKGNIEDAIGEIGHVLDNNAVIIGGSKHPSYEHINSALGYLNGETSRQRAITTNGAIQHISAIIEELKNQQVDAEAITDPDDGHLGKLHESLSKAYDALDSAYKALEEGKPPTDEDKPPTDDGDKTDPPKDGDDDNNGNETNPPLPPINPPSTPKPTRYIPAGTVIEVPLIIRTTNNQPASVRIGQVKVPQGVRVQQSTHTITTPKQTVPNTTPQALPTPIAPHQTIPSVRVSVGSKQVTIGNQTIEMDAAPYISASTSSTMVPVRFISEALGYEVNWDQDTAVVSITAPQTAQREARTIAFETGTSHITINGDTFTMVNANGDTVYSELTNDRAFIPFRALGYALNVYVMWDDETTTASFNPNIEYDTTVFIPVK